MSTAKSIICFFSEHNLPKPTWKQWEKERTGEREGDTRGILTGECQSGCLRKFGRDTMVIRTRKVGEKIKS